MRSSLQKDKDRGSTLAMPLEVASCTDVGLVRKTNEDYLRVLPEQGIVALADGMGGHLAGEVASEVAVEVAVEELHHAQRFLEMDAVQVLMSLGQAVERANASIYMLAHKNPELRGMGTTLVLALFHGGRVFYAHVGDSRLYLFRNGRLVQLTRDHSLIQEVVDHGIYPNRGEAREAGVGENVLTRSLGFNLNLNVDVDEVPVRPGDLFLFCSDGLSTPLSGKQIESLLGARQLSLESKVRALVRSAKDAGSTDNISVILARLL